MMVLGLGAVVGSPAIGYINDKFRDGRTVAFNMTIFHFITFSTFILCTINQSYGFLCFFSAFLMGATDSALMTQMSIIIANEFQAPA